MGQYHGIYNKTKKEYYSLGGAKLWEKAYCVPAHMGLLVLLSNSNGRGGGDLMNPIHADTHQFIKSKRVKRKTPIYSMWSNDKQKNIRCKKEDFDRIESALKLVQGRWAGDEIVCQGDYAVETDPAFIDKEATKDYKNITKLVVSAIKACLSMDIDGESGEVMRVLENEEQYLGV